MSEPNAPGPGEWEPPVRHRVEDTRLSGRQLALVLLAACALIALMAAFAILT